MLDDEDVVVVGYALVVGSVVVGTPLVGSI